MLAKNCVQIVWKCTRMGLAAGFRPNWLVELKRSPDPLAAMRALLLRSSMFVVPGKWVGLVGRTPSKSGQVHFLRSTFLSVSERYHEMLNFTFKKQNFVIWLSGKSLNLLLDFEAKMHQIQVWQPLPQTPLGELTMLPQPPSCIYGPYF